MRTFPRSSTSSVVLVLLVSALPGCHQTRTPRPVAASEAVPIPTTTPETPATPPSQPVPPPETKPKTLVLDEGGEETAEERSRTLLEASRLAKERRRTAPAPVAVITNQNLKDYAKRGNLVVGSSSAPPAGSEGGAQPSIGEKLLQDEIYWRTRARELREKWRNSVDSALELEARAEALRQEFYSEQDLYRRDTRVKPAWDRVLDRLAQAKIDAEQGRDNVVAFVEDGRRQGALPGWLREGIELEPEDDRVSDDELPEHKAIEPVVIDNNFR